MTRVQSDISAETKRIKLKGKIQMNAWCWLFMAMAVGFYILFQGYPIICSIQYSLLDWSGMTANAAFIGLQNYKELLQDELFWNAFFNSFKYMAMIVQFTELSGRCSVFERPLSDAKRPLFF